MPGGGGDKMADVNGASGRMARALWYAGPGVVELRAASLPPLAPGEARKWTRDYFEALGLMRLRGTIRYPEAA